MFCVRFIYCCGYRFLDPTTRLVPPIVSWDLRHRVTILCLSLWLSQKFPCNPRTVFVVLKLSVRQLNSPEAFLCLLSYLELEGQRRLFVGVWMIRYLFNFYTKNEQDVTWKTQKTWLSIWGKAREMTECSKTHTLTGYYKTTTILWGKNQKITNSHPRINQLAMVQCKWPPERAHQNPHKEAGVLRHRSLAGPCHYSYSCFSLLYCPRLVLGSPCWMQKSWHKAQLLTQRE